MHVMISHCGKVMTPWVMAQPYRRKAADVYLFIVLIIYNILAINYIMH